MWSSFAFVIVSDSGSERLRKLLRISVLIKTRDRYKPEWLVSVMVTVRGTARLSLVLVLNCAISSGDDGGGRKII